MLSKVIPLLAVAALLTACDDPKPAPASSGALTTATASTDPAAEPTASVATQPKRRQMPPRPVPIGSSGPIQPSAPAEEQMQTIQYTMAMVAPGPTDPLLDGPFEEELVRKLEAAVRTADKGKTPPNPIITEKGGRKIRVEMGNGCTDTVPANLVKGRAGLTLEQLYKAGILVISCHDAKWECHQSTRDPADVLCHAAPRR